MAVNITARLSRDDRWWLVHVPEINQYTQGRNVKDAKEMAADLTAAWLDIPIEDVHVERVEFELPDSVREDLDQATQLRKQAEEANRASAASVRHAARTLREGGLTIRDIGEVLGVSFQRADQLIRQP